MPYRVTKIQREQISQQKPWRPEGSQLSFQYLVQISLINEGIIMIFLKGRK